MTRKNMGSGPDDVLKEEGISEETLAQVERQSEPAPKSEGDVWRSLRGAAAGVDFDLAAFKKEERELEDRKIQEHFTGKRPDPGSGGSDQ